MLISQSINLLGSVIVALLGRRFAEDDELKHRVREEDPTLQQEVVSDRYRQCYAEVEKVC